MPIHSEELCSNMITSRRCFVFPLPVFFVPCSTGNKSTLLYPSQKDKMVYLKYLLFFYIHCVTNSILAVEKNSTRKLCIENDSFSQKIHKQEGTHPPKWDWSREITLEAEQVGKELLSPLMLMQLCFY